MTYRAGSDHRNIFLASLDASGLLLIRDLKGHDTRKVENVLFRVNIDPVILNMANLEPLEGEEHMMFIAMH